jgi:mannose-6-phosphate isomerase-like protein (cupin superfamily)
MPPDTQIGPIVRRATPADLPRIGRLGALLVVEHYDFDPLRFLPARPGTPAGYASFMSTQLKDPDKAVLVADDNGARHSHPGEELVYTIEGLLEYQVEGQPPVTLHAGEVLFIPAGTIHTVKNVGSGNAAELATYVVEKGKPLVLLVK